MRKELTFALEEMKKSKAQAVKPRKNLIFLKNGKNNKIAEMVQRSLENFLDLE